jgi:mono/diheme cytochrome c family protein
VLKGLWGPIEVNGQLFDPGKGVPPMMGFGGMLNDNELAAVLTYVRQSFGNDHPPGLRRIRQSRARRHRRPRPTST